MMGISRNGARAGDVLESLATTAAEVLESEASMGPDRALELGDSIAYKFAAREGGTAFYLPRGIKQQLESRDAEIRKKFNGFNYAALASEYKVTEMRIRQILAKPKK
ncbi:hypothetical protein EGT07_08015 [Herbaspirillum sp. HC18]|nr:hypothetical protein EGT07_08015 [Herbaspirillum sp. HC18]